jgi:hypothetical protein
MLHSQMLSVTDPKSGANCGIYLNYLSMPENTQNLFKSEQGSREDLTLQEVVEQGCSVTLGYFRRTFESITRTQSKEFRLMSSESYESTVHKFLRTFAERLLIEYCNASEKMPEM